MKAWRVKKQTSDELARSTNMSRLLLPLAIMVLLSSGARSQVGGEGRVEDLLSVAAKGWREDYSRLLQSPSTDALSQCGPFLESRQCATNANTVQATLSGSAEFLVSPSRLSSLCVSYNFSATWNELASSYPDVPTTQWRFTDSRGDYVVRYASPQANSSLLGFDGLCGVPIPDPRTNDQAYVRTTSSPKLTTILNLTTGSRNSSQFVLWTILSKTLAINDYVVLQGFPPPANNSDVILSTPGNIAQLLQEAVGGMGNENETLSWLDINTLNKSLGSASALQNSFNISVCYQNLFVILDQDLSEEIATVIRNAYSANPSLLVLIYNIGKSEGLLTSRDFPVARSLLCDTRTVFEDLSVMDERSQERTVLDSLNYFSLAPPSGQSSKIVWTTHTSIPLLSTVCVPMFDVNTGLVSQSGVLLGTLCVDVVMETIPFVEVTCPSNVTSLYEFSFIRSVFTAMPPQPNCPAHLQGTPTIALFTVYGDFLRTLVLQEQFSFILINQTSLVGDVCPSITGHPLLSCGGITNFSQPISLDDSSLLWTTRLGEVLPLATSDFSSLNSSELLWQSVCSSSFLLSAWEAIYSSRPPITLTYSDYSSGYIRTYPGYQATDEECAELDLLDARLQPWFTSTASGPKALLMIVDVQFNFPDSISDIRTGLTTLLNSLNQYDYFAVSYSNQNLVSMTTITVATQDNISITRRFIQQANFSSGKRDVKLAASTVVTMVTDATSNPLLSGHNIAVVVFSDNSFIDPGTASFTSPLTASMDIFTDNNIRVFTLLFSAFQEGTILKGLSCATGGLYDRLYNLSTYDISIRVINFYSFFAAVRQPLGQQTWSEVTSDIVTGLNSTRVCEAVYRTSQEGGVASDDVYGLLGVLCISVPVENVTTGQQQVLERLIYNTKPAAVRPNLTFDQENTLRGIHRCDALLSTSAESFRYRVEQVVRLFRVVMETAFTNSADSEVCTYGDSFFDSCSTPVETMPPLAPSTQFSCSVNFEASELYSRGFLAGVIPLLNFSVNAFRASSAEAFSLLCSTQSLNNLWVSQQNALLDEPGVLWRYYGDALSGLMRYHPYADCGLSDPMVCATRSFDPRLRPWFVSSVSGPKAVYMLIHSTDQVNYQLMLDTVMAAVETLTHRDSIIIWFTDSGADQLAEKFSPANVTNRQRQLDFVLSRPYSPSDQDISDQLHFALQSFQTTEGRSDCHDVILLFTDASLPPSLPVSVQRSQATFRTNVDIFTYSFGGIIVDASVAMVIACENGGEGFVVDARDVELRVHLYLNFYAALLQNGGVVWSDYFQDVFTEKTVLSACLPIYDPQSVETAPLLLGVTCVDIDPTRFNDFPDGQLVLDTLINPEAIYCPRNQLSEDQREAIRQTKCRSRAADSPEGLINIFVSAVRQAAIDHALAYEETLSVLNQTSGVADCLFKATLYDSCNLTPTEATQFSPSDELSGGANVSFSGLGVIYSPLIGSAIFNPLTSNEPLYSSLCPAIVQSRTWKRTRSSYNVTTFQFFSSEDGFVLIDPAVQPSAVVCNDTSFDPRLRQYYTSAASGYKDVVLLIDLETNGTLSPSSIYERASTYVLSTLSTLDYFGIVAGQDVLDSTLIRGNSTGLNRAARFVSTLKYQTRPQHEQIKQAFQVLSSSRENGLSSDCQAAIVIITNRGITMETLNIVATENANYKQSFSQPLKVFVNSFINRPDGNEELELVCSHSGLWNLITPRQFNDSLLVRQKVTSYYRVLAKALTLTEPIWSEVYDDLLGEGNVSTVCLPVYDTFVDNGKLLGVTCVDVPLELFEMVNGTKYLLDVISSQRNQGNCFAVTLSNEEIDILRADGAKCSSLSATTQPPTGSMATTFIPMTTSETTTTTGVQTGVTTATSTRESSTTELINGPSTTSVSVAGLSPGATAAIVICLFAVGLCLLAALTVVIIYFYRKKRNTTGTLRIASEDQLQEKLLDESDDDQL